MARITIHHAGPNDAPSRTTFDVPDHEYPGLLDQIGERIANGGLVTISTRPGAVVSIPGRRIQHIDIAHEID